MKKLYIVLLTCLLSSSLISQNFEEITGTPFEGVRNSSIAFADVDNDGDQDVLITGSSIAKLYTNNGDGNFIELIGTPFVGVAYGSIAFADIDNDGDQDVLITGDAIYTASDHTTAILYTNNGNGNFSEVLDTPFDGVQESSIAFADIDNDGDQDVLITGRSGRLSNISKLYTNDGNGVFTEVLNTPFVRVGDSSVAFADIDNDSDQDVLITGYFGDGAIITKLYNNNGSGEFEGVSGTPFEAVSNGSIAFADIDSDGDQDVLITGGSNSGSISKLYTNDGNGNFTEVLDTPFVGVGGSSIAFADIDNDNDQDVLITGSGIAKLYTNDGNGNFSEILDIPFDGVGIGSIAFADIDNDGDQDVLITGSNGGEGTSKLYRNLTIVGINENTLFSSVSIYPNPNKGLINIDLGNLSDVSIKVLNLSGQLIYYKEDINSPIYQFDLNAAPGIYILELSAEGEKQQFKLVKN